MPPAGPGGPIGDEPRPGWNGGAHPGPPLGPPPSPVAGSGGDGVTPPSVRPGTGDTARELLSPQARSVLVPAVVTALTGLVILLASAVGAVLGVVAASEASEDLPDGAPSNLECAFQRRSLQLLLDDYEQRRGRAPTSERDLGVEVLDSAEYRIDFTVDPPAVRPRPGSTCAADAEVSILADWDEGEDAWSVASAASALVPIGLGGLGLTMGCWWLASAYRCLPRNERRHPVGHAFRLVRVVVVANLGLAAALGLAVGPAAGEPIVAGVVLLLGYLVSAVLHVRAVLRAIDMIGDITFVYRRGRYTTARIMRTCVMTIVLALPTAFLLALLAGARDSSIAAIGFLVVLCAAITAAVVGAIAAVVAVVQVTVAIESTLRRAAAEIAAGPAEPDGAVRRPVGV